MQQTIEGFRLSPQQTRLWLLQQHNNAYCSFCSLVIEGQLHIPTLRQVVELVFRQHEMYRTSFRRLPGVKMPVQVVNTSPLYVWRHCDISTCSPLDQQKQLDQWNKPTEDGVVSASTFDLERGLFAQCTLVTLAKEKHILFIHIHALYADTATLAQFAQEVAHIYKNGAPVSVPDAQYLHFSEWQNALLEKEGEHFVKTYWQEKYKEVFTSLTLPFEQKHFEQVTFSPTWLAITINSDICAQVEGLIEQAHWLQKQPFPLPAFLLACWQILLWRLTGQEDLLIGLGVDGRTYEELAGIAGLIAKDMPFVCHLTPDLSFGKLLAQTHKTADKLLSLYPYFSWEVLEDSTATALGGHRGDPLRSPTGYIYPFSFDFKQQPAISECAGVSFSLQQCYAYHEPFKIKLVAVRRASCLSIEMHHDANLFDSRDIQRVAQQFTTLVEHAVKHPEARIGELNMLSLVERKQLLVNLNQTQEDRTGTSSIRPHDLCLHQWFERQVASTPDAVAIYHGEKQLTYRGIDCWANRLARHLQARGVQAETLVGLCMAHSVELLVGILGVLKAGGAYMPLDPASPKKRLASLAADGHLTVLLTTQALLEDMPEIEHLVCLDTYLETWETLARYDGETPPACSVLPLNLAYVIYTSGSTGQPKGVMISHKGLVHYVNWAIQRYEVAAGAGTPLHSSLAFDLTVTSLFPSLVVGRAVWIMADDSNCVSCAPQEALASALRTGPDFSLVKLTPALLDLLNQWLTPADLASTSNFQPAGATRMLVIGGEALRAESLTMWRLHASETRLINEYGPTETVVGCCVYEVPPVNSPQCTLRSNVPIGRPIANTQIYLLDSHMQPVPLGVVGEIYIGGLGLGRGYLHRADLTAERFVPHPFVEIDSPLPRRDSALCLSGARLYKTGDLARYISADGDLEYVGRIDEQIKVHGYRIEPGEIEGVLAQHPAVRECVVVAREDAVGDRQLVAYIVGVGPVPTQEAQPLIAELQKYLRELLPSYMVPSWFVLLKALPLTVNGKVDRRSLPAPESQSGQEAGTPIASRTAIQELLAQLWCEVLGRSQVSIFDSFFELGGHSLLATRLMAQIQAILQVELPVRAVFEEPTLVGLAQRVEQALRKSEGIVVPPLMPMERPEKIPLSFAQQRLWFIDQLEPDSTAYLAPYALYLHGELNVGALERGLRELVYRHECLRTTFEMRDEQPVQVIHPAIGEFAAPTSPAYLSLQPVIDLQGLKEEQREEVARCLTTQEAERPCNLAKGPLLRTYLLQLKHQKHVLLLTLHHIITDGWSNEVLVRDLTTLYRAKVLGQPSPLAPLPIQYADYALWQREWMSDGGGSCLSAQLTYWRKQLANLPRLELLVDYPRLASQTYQGATLSLDLSEELSQSLVRLSRQEGVTLFMLGLAAFQVLLMRYTGQTNIHVGTPIANRTRTEIEGVIGFFVNTLVIRTDLSGNPMFLEVLKQVREVCLSAYTYQDLPFEKLVEVLQPERDSSGSPLYQISFHLEYAIAFSQLSPELSVEALEHKGASANDDLRVMMIKTPQGFCCTAFYNSNLFKAQTIRRFLEHFQTLLQGIVLSPEMPVALLPLLSEQERHMQLVEWNATKMDFPQDRCVHQLFEEQAQRTPDAVALVFECQTLTYAELNRRANQLGHHLQKVGLGPDGLVGICMQRSVEMVMALLGVLKAGGAYVPLDPQYPTERLAFMLDNAQVALVITTSTLLTTTKLDTVSFQAIYLDRDWPAIAQQDREDLVNGVLAEHLAYVIYTSGSTGTPKGVAVSHRAIVNRLLWSQQAFPLTNWDRVLQIASVSFDIALWELFGPLVAGARVLLAPPSAALDRGELVHRLIEQAITIAHTVPSLLRVWLLEPAFKHTQQLRHLFCGGEAWWPGLAHSFREQHHARLTQWYGPTEASINVTSWTCPTPTVPDVAPIGRPIANTQIYLLDGNGQPVPVGVIGEIYLGGVCLARGYLGQADLTAERFVPNPFVGGGPVAQGTQATVPTLVACPQPGARLYRTGDRARYLADGHLEFLGRLDQQMKVRGIRVELGEIEAVLLQHPAVREAVVLAQEDTEDDKRLLAYLVLQPEQEGVELWPSVGEYFVYDELIYTGLTNDEARNALYKAEGAGVILNNIGHFLTPQATMIPTRSLTRIAAVRLPEELREKPAFTEVSSHYVRKIFEQVGHPFDLRLCIKNFPLSHLLPNGKLDRYAVPQVDQNCEGRLQYWQQLYDETYRQESLQADATFNTVGWNSSYTNQPIPTEEMLTWLEDTVALVETYLPKRLLEIGCGTGLLLFRLAPLCNHYYGTDFSATALEGIRQQLASSKKRGMQAKVTLLQRQADDFSALPQGLVDTVLINSVVQYFPNVNYLLRVLDGALRLVTPGGKIIVGDVRSLPLLGVFHASVQLYRAPETLTRQQLWQRVQRHLQQEEELVIAPAFFRHWAQATGKVSHVEVRIKRGRQHNELTQFRYQVVMHVGEPVTAGSAKQARLTEEALNWTEQSMTLERLCEKLTRNQPKRLRLWQVPNARVSQAVQTLQWLKGESGPETVGQWRIELGRRGGVYPHPGVEPEDLWEQAEQLGYRVTINWEHQSTDGSYTVLLEQRDSEQCGDAEEELVQQTKRSEPVMDWHLYVNQPLRRGVERPLVQQVQQYLQEKLPDYMVPANLVVLSALPLLPNGKVDRRALPAPEEVQHKMDEQQEQARTPMEELLLGLWSEVLDRTQLGVSENFFDVGGHSLLATQLIARVRAVLGVEVPVRVIFEAPTVIELAWRIEQTLRKSAGIELSPLVPIERPAEIPLSSAQQRLWFLDQLYPASTTYLNPEVLRFRGVLNTQALERSLQEIIHRHEILRTTFEEHAGQPLQVIHSVGAAACPCPVLPLIDLQGLGQEKRAEAAKLLARQEAQCPCDLAKGPLLRTYLLRLDMQEHMFLLTLHHIITDGWSTGVLIRELTTLYQTNISGLRTGSETVGTGLAPVRTPTFLTLPDLPIQYADYALWQHQCLQGEVLQKHIAYWQHQLEGASILELPTDVPRTAVQSNHGARYSFVLPADLSAQVVSLSRQEGVTLFMTLLAAFQVLLYRLTGQTDIVVGTDVANRTHVETETLIGFFVNLLALRTKVQGTLSFRNMLPSVRTMVLGAYSHQEIPFELVIEQLELERKGKQTPLVQVLFVLQNTPTFALSLPGIELEVMESVSTMAKFDLALFLQEEPEGIRGFVVYRSALFKEQTVATLVHRLEILLGKVVAKPDTPVDELEISTDEEKAVQMKYKEERSRANREYLRMKRTSRNR